MAETRRKRAALAVGADDLEGELARVRQRLAREGALKLSTLKAGALRGTFSDMAKVLDAAGKKKNDGLLASDIEQMLSAAQRVLEEDSAPSPVEEVPADEAATAPAPAVSAREVAAREVAARDPAMRVPAASAEVDPLAALLAALDAARDAGSGMSFVPAVVRRLSAAMPVSEALELLMQAARRELIELRPEGGLGRLSGEELALCPPGPAGTRLSWARRSEGASA